ncbi:MAG: DUF2804 family protein [Clostridia bacterium]
MSNYPSYISEKRRPIATPKAIVDRGQAVFGTFSEPFETLNLRDCEQPCGFLLPHFMNRTRLTEWEAFEVNMDECSLISAVYNTGLLGFSIIVFYDKRTNKITSFKNFVPGFKAKVAPQLVSGVSQLKTKHSSVTITNDFKNGKATAVENAKNKAGNTIEMNMSVERIAPISNVSIPFGKNKPLYSEKDFFKATGYITINGEKLVTNENSVSIIDDHKGYYPYHAHYDWLTTMGKCKIDGEDKFFAFNLTRNQSTNQDDFNENLIWLENESFPLPPVVFTHDSKNKNIWYAKDEHGCVDIRFEIADTFSMPMHFVVVSVDYDLPFGKIYGFVKDTNGKKYVVDGMLGIGEDKTTRM